jgi:hypothetical protein
MKKLILAAAATLALSAAAMSISCAPAQAAQKQANCLVVVHGKTYFNGTCNYDDYGNGGFLISSRSHGGYAQVVVDGRALGIWNNKALGLMLLGPMLAKGPCWVNAEAKICAFGPFRAAASDQCPQDGTLKGLPLGTAEYRKAVYALPGHKCIGSGPNGVFLVTPDGMKKIAK